MRRIIIRSFAYGALFASISMPAEAARISLVGVADSSTPNQSGTEYTPQTGYGYGVLLEARVVPFIGFEVGALSAPRKFSYNSSSTTENAYTAKTYEFPALLRLHLGRTLSFGVGGYYAKANGQLGLDSTTNGTTTSSSVSYASQQYANTDYGALGSVALSFRLGPLTHLLIDGRYLMGLKNVSLAPGGDTKINDMELLAGLQFGF